MGSRADTRIPVISERFLEQADYGIMVGTSRNGRTWGLIGRGKEGDYVDCYVS